MTKERNESLEEKLIIMRQDLTMDGGKRVVGNQEDNNRPQANEDEVYRPKKHTVNENLLDQL